MEIFLDQQNRIVEWTGMKNYQMAINSVKLRSNVAKNIFIQHPYYTYIDAFACNIFMAFFVHAHPTIHAPKSGTAKPPDGILAKGTYGPFIQPFWLKAMSVDKIFFLVNPTTCSSPIDCFIFTRTWGSWCWWFTKEYMNLK
jgi:hypothetical protein